MTLRETINNALNIQTPDSQTIQKNISSLAEIAKTLSKEDQQKIVAITNGMKQQQAVAQKKEEQQAKEKNTVQQPAGQAEQKAQIDSTTSTAQITDNKETAQISNN